MTRLLRRSYVYLASPVVLSSSFSGTSQVPTACTFGEIVITKCSSRDQWELWNLPVTFATASSHVSALSCRLLPNSICFLQLKRVNRGSPAAVPLLRNHEVPGLKCRAADKLLMSNVLVSFPQTLQANAEVCELNPRPFPSIQYSLTNLPLDPTYLELLTAPYLPQHSPSFYSYETRDFLQVTNEGS